MLCYSRNFRGPFNLAHPVYMVINALKLKFYSRQGTLPYATQRAYYSCPSRGMASHSRLFPPTSEPFTNVPWIGMNFQIRSHGIPVIMSRDNVPLYLLTYSLSQLLTYVSNLSLLPAFPVHGVQ